MRHRIAPGCAGHATLDPMATNQISGVTVRPVAPASDEADSPAGHALFMALDIAEPTRLLGFLEDVVTRFKAERMTGPADAQFLLITVAGEVSATDFADAWRAAIANDAPARALLGTMQAADVMQGDPHGVVLGQASLLASAALDPSLAARD
jgi:hypothetical protein